MDRNNLCYFSIGFFTGVGTTFISNNKILPILLSFTLGVAFSALPAFIYNKEITEPSPTITYDVIDKDVDYIEYNFDSEDEQT